MHKVVGSLHTGMYTMFPMYPVHCTNSYPVVGKVTVIKLLRYVTSYIFK